MAQMSFEAIKAGAAPRFDRHSGFKSPFDLRGL